MNMNYTKSACMKCCVVLAACMASLAAAQAVESESPLKRLNELGCGIWDARVQTVSMYRDYEYNDPGNAYASSLGLRLGYSSPELAGFSAGLVWDYAEPVDASDSSNNGKTLLGNGRVNLLTEAWIGYRFEDLGLSDTWLKAGPQIVNGEIFRADEFRQKPRSLEAVSLTSKDLRDTAIEIGHAWRLSNWIQNEEAWKFNDLSETLGVEYSTPGITWAEMVNTSIEGLEFAAYDAYAYDIVNVAGGRAKYSLSDCSDLNGYYRHEGDVGKGASHSSDMAGAALAYKIVGVSLEGGYFGVYGDDLLFQETTTGINHPLGSLMMIYAGQFNGGSDTAYLKTTTRIADTILYLLYSYTKHEHDKTDFDGQELNMVVKQCFTDRFSIALKLGMGYRDGKNSTRDTSASDSRLFVTYKF